MHYKTETHTMKKIKILLPLLLSLTWMTLHAQRPGPPRDRMMDRGEKKEQIESMKIAFITRRLDLTPEEAQRFWTVYNKYADELHALRKDRRERNRDAREDFDKLGDKEVEKLVDDEIIFRQQELDVIKKYHAQFKSVLPIKKVARLYRAEEEFKRELLERIRERKEEMRR